MVALLVAGGAAKVFPVSLKGYKGYCHLRFVRPERTRMALSGFGRRGLLGLPSVLTMTHVTDRTRSVTRGKIEPNQTCPWLNRKSTNIVTTPGMVIALGN